MCSVVFTMITLPSGAVTEAGSSEEEEEFNTSEVVMHHIADAHEWHLWGDKAIYLPVILYTGEGLKVFSSSHFYHHPREITYTAGGEEHTESFHEHNGLALFHEKIYYLDETGGLSFDSEGHPLNEKPLDLSITKNVASLLISVVLIILIFSSVARSYEKRRGKAPRGLQSLLEPVILFVRDEIARPNIGHKYHRYMPYLLSVFFFIWLNNLLGLIPFFPGGANLSGNIAFTLVMGVFTFLVTNFSGNKHYWKHIFKPHVPWWLYPIMVPVEIISVLSKPFALIVRLFANITAGHIVVLSLVSLIFIFKTVAMAPVSVAFVLFIDLLELLVAFLQAFIFTMLSALFIGMAVAEPSAETEH